MYAYVTMVVMMKTKMKEFAWEGKKRGLIDWKQAIAPKEEGGLSFPDIEYHDGQTAVRFDIKSNCPLVCPVLASRTWRLREKCMTV
jgi:hypothetical protein